MRLSQLAVLFVVWVFLATVAVFFGLPLLWLVLASFDPEASPAFRIPSHPSLENYAKLWVPLGAGGGTVAGPPPYQWIINSTIISVCSATLATVASVLAAYVMTRHKFRGQGAMMTSFIIFRLVPPIIIALPIMVLYKFWGLMNTWEGLIIALAALVLPFTMMIAEGFFRSIPIIYEEAAMVDGCTRLGAFLRITLKLAAPGIATIWLLAFVVSWSEFILPLMIIKNIWLMPASVGLQYFFGEHGVVDYGRLTAFSVLYSIPAVVAYFTVQKYLRRGIAGLVTR